MIFLVDQNKKLILGWSAKCGCTHIKYLFRYLTNRNPTELHDKIHSRDIWSCLPKNYKEYKIIIYVRNPYERLISGFLDKYSPRSKEFERYNNMWKTHTDKEITFKNFVDELISGNFNSICVHHFDIQFSNEWRDCILQHDDVSFYDINSIDHAIFENIYNIKIPKHVKDFKGQHVNKKKRKYFKNEEKIYEKLLDYYIDYRPDTICFFNDDIKQKVDNFYKKDFITLKKVGLNYELK